MLVEFEVPLAVNEPLWSEGFHILTKDSLGIVDSSMMTNHLKLETQNSDLLLWFIYNSRTPEFPWGNESP